MSSAHYKTFHDHDPSVYLAGRLWVPGRMVALGSGKAIDVGYGIVAPSSKDGGYVHDFGKGVKIYRRADRYERGGRTYRRFPTELMVLGRFLGLTYKDTHGRKVEVRGTRLQLLCTDKSRRKLIVLHKQKGVEYLMQGGQMHVKDWIYK